MAALIHTKQLQISFANKSKRQDDEIEPNEGIDIRKHVNKVHIHLLLSVHKSFLFSGEHFQSLRCAMPMSNAIDRVTV